MNKKDDQDLSSDPSPEKLSTLFEHYKNGRFSDAESLAATISQEFPQHPFSWKVLGLLFKQLGRVNESVAAMQRSVNLAPQDAEAQNNLGVMLQELGRFEEAETSFTEAVSLSPDYALAHYNLGNTLKEMSRLEEAMASYTRAIAIEPNYTEAHNNMGHTLQELGKFEESEASLRRAILLKPGYAEAYYNLGNTLKGLGRSDESEASYNQAILFKPDYAEAFDNLGNTLRELGRLDEAEASHRKAIALQPDLAEAYSNLGITLTEMGRSEEAEANQRQAIALTPDSSQAHCNLGITLQEAGRLDEAEASFNKAVALNSDCNEAHLNLSFLLLKSGRLEEGLDKYERRWNVAEHKSKDRHFPRPVWDGKKSLQGKRILLWSEQGIGDTLNWVSCLPLVASLASHTILECQIKILPLLARSFPNIEIRPEDRSMDSKRDDFDFHLPMGSLYRHFISHIGQNSNVEPYLTPNPARVEFWRDRLGSLGHGPYIGISWKSSLVSPYRLRQYPSISEWSSVLTAPNVTFINLQYSDFTDDLIDIRENLGVTVHHFEDLDQYNDVDEVAALCAALDMVVSAKATPMIFSSGVGTPTKVFYWRQSIWNSILFNPVCSSVEMFYRDTLEPWDNVFNSITESISKLKHQAI